MTLDAPVPLAPRPIVRHVLVDAPEVCVADVALGLTVYLAEPLIWARAGAAHMLARFATLARGTGVRWWTTSRLTTWRHAEVSQAATLVPELMRPALTRPRHLLSFRWVDDVNAPGAGVHYLEIDDDQGVAGAGRPPQRAGVLQIFLPQSHNPSALVDLARAIGDEWPVWSAIGGYVATSHARDRPTSFETAYRWCRRYLGLDVQDPVAMSWRATRGLPGTNWLTLVGTPLLEALALDRQALMRRPTRHDVRAAALHNGVLFQAGAAPTLGDLNRGDLAPAYAEVARTLAKAFVAEPPGFLGSFAEGDGTSAWFRRFLAPEDWARR